MYLGNFIKNLNKKYHKTYFSGVAFNSKKVKKDNIFLQSKERSLMEIDIFGRQLIEELK